MRARPNIGGSNCLLPGLLLISFIYITSAEVSVQYLDSKVGYPTAGGVTVTVIGSGFGSTTSVPSVTIGSSACAQAKVAVSNSRITCKLGTLRLCSRVCTNPDFSRRCVSVGRGHGTNRSRHHWQQHWHHRLIQIRCALLLCSHHTRILFLPPIASQVHPLCSSSPASGPRRAASSPSLEPTSVRTLLLNLWSLAAQSALRPPSCCPTLQSRAR